MADLAVSASLVPSQAFSSRASSNGSNHSSSNQQNKSAIMKTSQKKAKPDRTTESEDFKASVENSSAATGKSSRRRRRRKNQSEKKGNESASEQQDPPEEAEAEEPKAAAQNKANKPNRRKNKSKAMDESSTRPNQSQSGPQHANSTTRTSQQKNTQQGRKRHPWRKLIPRGTVDPITLDPLNSLPYPPFALCANSPYEPIPEWPIPEERESSANKSASETEELRQRRLLEEQWGHVVKQAVTKEEETNNHVPLLQRKLNLYDGRALAYYMVSQLQFIDPLNRRDLTRDELVSLNRYLHRHGFHDLDVVDAYDARGISLSTAGAAASTEDGRAAIRQQEAQALAQQLLNNVFAGVRSVHREPDSSNSLQQQYAASQRQELLGHQQVRNTTQLVDSIVDSGIYGTEEGGFVVIDDDANPGLRGGPLLDETMPALAADAPSFTPGTLWSASHITGRYISHEASQRAKDFPALAPSSSMPVVETSAGAVQESAIACNKTSGPSRSLARITKIVAKTDPKELQKQRDARELFIKRAAMSNLSFSSDPSQRLEEPSGLLTPPALQPVAGTTESLLLRNQAFAAALGVVPATVREQSLSKGWARPTDNQILIDEFGNELNAANYPDSLIMAARERMDLVLKLEKKWKTFLADDTAASLPLSKMDRPTRTFVHEYSDYWKLHTESFDPEPNRYIHCVKLRDTSAPAPLLSEAARNWRGPRPFVVDQTDRVLKQTAGQAPREFPPSRPREPLVLKPRSVDSKPSGFSASATMKLDTESEAQINSRSEDLLGRQRRKLELMPRTLPIERPAMEEAINGYSLVEERERQKAAGEEQLRLKKEEEEKKRRILQWVFASDDEDADSLKSHNSSEWDDVEDQEEQYSGSDDEEG